MLLKNHVLAAAGIDKKEFEEIYKVLVRQFIRNRGSEQVYFKLFGEQPVTCRGRNPYRQDSPPLK